jgi:DNA-binding MarR family transcriptional regulator
MGTPQRETEIDFDYRLDDQVGFVMRQVNQRHLSIFSRLITDFTPTQFATLAKIFEIGTVSQNDLGRQTAMDAATMKGVIDRLSKKGLVTTRPDPGDLRRLLVELTAAGERAYQDNVRAAARITEETLAPLNGREQAQLANLLGKMINTR